MPGSSAGRMADRLNSGSALLLSCRTLDNPTVDSVVVKQGKGVITTYRLNDKLTFTLGAGLTGLKQLKYL